MTAKEIILLSLLVTQAVCAPSGCIESCTSYQRTYQSHGSNSYQENAGLTQASSNSNLDYARPGNWTEHNLYKTDDGHGRVFEERGQYVQGPKTVRYFRKNYTSSYSSGHPAGWTGSSQFGEDSNSYGHTLPLPSPSRVIVEGDRAGSTAQQEEYRRMHSQRVESLTSSSGRSANLEDFGEYRGNVAGIQRNGRTESYHSGNTEPGNWSKVDSFETDGGRGRVFEEEGQYETGPKRVRYYKRNYTSSYSTGGSALGVDLQKEVEKLHREIDASSRNIHHGSTLGINDHQTSESTAFGQQTSHAQRLTSTLHRDEDLIQKLHPVPSQNTFDTGSQSVFEKHEAGYVSRVHAVPTSASRADSDYARSSFRREEEQRRLNELRQREYADSHRSRVVENEMSRGDMRQNLYNQHATLVPGASGQTSHFREEWGSSSHTREETGPRMMQQSQQEYRNQYGNRHSSYRSSQHQTHVSEHRESGYNSAHDVKPEKFVNGVVDFGQGADCTGETQQIQYRSRHHRNYKRGAHFDEFPDSQQQQQSEDLTQQQSEDLTQQQSEDLTQQQSEDLTQQNEEFDQLQQHQVGQHDDTQQTRGKLEFGQQSEDLTQQTMGKLEFGQQSEDLTQQSEDLRQHATGTLEFGTQQNEDLTQQTTGNLEFGTQEQQEQQQHQQHLEDMTQQNEDLTQQRTGKLEFGQQEEQQQHQQHSEDFTQQNEDLTQQTVGKLELGTQQEQQQHQQHSDDYTQQSEDLTQQRTGKLEFGTQQEQQHPEHLEDFTQQNEDLTEQRTGRLEFGQHTQQRRNLPSQTYDPRFGDFRRPSQADDLVQQTTGNLEFGQQIQPNHYSQIPTGNQHLENPAQSSEADDLTQHASGKLEFPGQQTGSDGSLLQTTGNTEFGWRPQKPWIPGSSQNVNDADRTRGTLEFGGQSHTPHVPRYEPDNDSWTQETSGLDDFTQQTGKLEFGGQEQYLPEFHQTTGTDYPGNFGHQAGRLELGQEHQTSFNHPWAPSRNPAMEDLSQNSEDLTQQVGKWEFGPYYRKPYRPYPMEDYQQGEDETQKTDEISQMGFGVQTGFGQTDDQTVPGESRPSVITPSEEPGLQTENQTPRPRPAQKPKPRPRYTRPGQVQINEPVDKNQTPAYHSEDEKQDVSKPKNQRTQTTETAEGGDTSVNDFSPASSDVDIEVDNDDAQRGNLRGDQGQETTTTTETPKDMGQQTQVMFDMNRGHADHSNWLHKSNDVTVGWQWHYTYHPSDLTNSELTPGYHPGYGYPRKPGVTQSGEERPNYDQGSEQSKPWPTQPAEHETQHRPQPVGVKTSRRRPNRYFQQENQYLQQARNDRQYDSHGQTDWSQMQSQNAGYEQQNQQNTDEVQRVSQVGQLGSVPRPMRDNGQGKETGEEPKVGGIEPRILEAFGGGPYDGTPNDDIYIGVTPKPSVTLPPTHAEDPWDIRVKPREPVTFTVETTTEAVTEAEVSEIPPETPPPSFWGRVGNKITSTFDKARERARTIFG